jgi:hypothetical protein
MKQVPVIGIRSFILTTLTNQLTNCLLDQVTGACDQFNFAMMYFVYEKT